MLKSQPPGLSLNGLNMYARVQMGNGQRLPTQRSTSLKEYETANSMNAFAIQQSVTRAKEPVNEEVEKLNGSAKQRAKRERSNR